MQNKPITELDEVVEYIETHDSKKRLKFLKGCDLLYSHVIDHLIEMGVRQGSFTSVCSPNTKGQWAPWLNKYFETFNLEVVFRGYRKDFSDPGTELPPIEIEVLSCDSENECALRISLHTFIVIFIFNRPVSELLLNYSVLKEYHPEIFEMGFTPLSEVLADRWSSTGMDYARRMIFALLKGEEIKDVLATLTLDDVFDDSVSTQSRKTQ